MSAPRGIQRKRTAGWRAPEGAISVTRPGPWGNRFVVGAVIAMPRDAGWLEVVITPELAVALHKAWLAMPEQGALVARSRVELRGHDLLCYCAEGDACHRETWIEVSNS